MGKSSEMAECTIVVEPSIDRNDIKKKNLYWFSSKGETLRLSPYTLLHAANRQNEEYLMSLDLPKEMLDMYKAKANKANKESRRLETQGMGELVTCIADGRVRLSLLLDTAGGLQNYQDEIKKIQEFLSRSGGEFMAFGGERVFSLGALLLMTAAKGDRYVHPMSQVMFHLGESDPRMSLSRRDFQRDRKWEIEKLCAELIGETVPEKRKEMKKWLKKNLLAERPKRKDRPVELSGKSMEGWGMAKSLRIEPMRQEYLKRHGIVWESVEGTPIDHFFGRLQQYEVESDSVIKRLLAVFKAENDENDE